MDREEYKKTSYQYKEHIEKIKMEEMSNNDYTYQFHIQTYDSPAGDEWISGVAEYRPNGVFKILNIERRDY